MLGLPSLTLRTMQDGRSKIHTRPAQVAASTRPQAMAVGDQYHGGVSVRPTVSLGGFQQSLDLGCRQVFAGSQIGDWDVASGQLFVLRVAGATSLRLVLAMISRLPAPTDSCSYNAPRYEQSATNCQRSYEGYTLPACGGGGRAKRNRRWLTEAPTCRCDNGDHGHVPGKCPAPLPRSAGDGLCEACSQKIAQDMERY